MKNYFGFSLTGKKMLPIWLVFYFLFITPYAVLIAKMTKIQEGTTPPVILVVFLFLSIICAFLITFYLAKIMIENFLYKDKPISFNGNFGKFIGVILLGGLLSIVTLGIYAPWFITNIHKFFVDSSEYENEPFTFQGRGDKLFVIMLLTILLPIIVITMVTAGVLMLTSGHIPPSYEIIQQVVMWIIMIPYMYFVYKWMVNINYKNYNIKWETQFWDSCGKLALEMFLSIITIGIYFPMAAVKLYAYFTEKTVAQSDEIKRHFGFDKDNVNDFVFIWGQTLLSIITLGIYYPWAISKIGKRILSRTYLE